MDKAAPCRNSEVPKLQVPIHIDGKAFTLELDAAAGGNFFSTRVWTELGKPKLQQAQWRNHSASRHPLPIIGAFTTDAKYGNVSNKSYPISFLVSEILDLHLLGRDAIRAMRISLGDLLFSEATFGKTDHQFMAIPRSDRVDRHLNRYVVICAPRSASFSSPSWGCRRGVQLVVKYFNQTLVPSSANHAPFHLPCRKNWRKPTMLESLGGIWTPTSFNDWGTAVVPVRSFAVFPTNLLYAFAVITL